MTPEQLDGEVQELQGDEVAQHVPLMAARMKSGWRSWPLWWNWRGLRNENPEVTAVHMTGAARGPFIGWIAVFSVVALTGLGEKAQNCDTREVDFGAFSVATSSVVSLALTLEGVVNAILSPMLGALADSTSRRTMIFRITLVVLCLCVVGACVTLFFAGSVGALVIFAVFLVFVSLSYDAMSILHQSYIPELADDSKARTKISSTMYLWLNGFQMTYVAMAVGLTLVLGVSNDKELSPQIAGAMAALFWLALALPGMYLLDERVKEVKFKAGFMAIPRLARMIKEVWRDYPQVGIYLIGYSLYATAASAVVALAQSYIITEMGIQGFQLQVIIFLTLIFTLPGALLIVRMSKWLGSVRRANIAIVAYWCVILGTIPLLLVGEDNPDKLPSEPGADCAIEDAEQALRIPSAFSSYFVYVEAVLWGLGIGAIYPINVVLMAEIVPGGEEASFYGLKTFAGKVISWAPPLLYTIINDATLNPRLSILGILPFMCLGLVFAILLNVTKGKEDISHTLHRRHGNTEQASDGSGDNSAAITTAKVDHANVDI